ncbi:MAG: enoyl-CoA hydratase/isomerase family protein [Acidimicrobiales bacterium]|nr:enoyl-CoA hydratase/isomerase family protein [Acidimicrobiales bacterium]
MEHDEYEALQVHREAGVVTAVIDHPPVNLLDDALIGDLFRLATAAGADPDVRVVVLRSALAEFFIAHADLETLLGFPRDAGRAAEIVRGFHGLVELFRTMPAITIAVIEGRVGGGGSELALSCDLRIAADTAVFSQPEVALGILPGGSGTQRLTRLLGRARALEVVVGCDDVDAGLAERWGWVNRTLPADGLDRFVDRLCRRIASFPAGAVAAAKRSVDAAGPAWDDGLAEEARLFGELVVTDEARQLMRRALELGAQTRDGELRIQELLAHLGGEG